jgi:hypothetical protein
MCDCGELDDIVSCGDDENEFIRQRRLRLLRAKQDAGLYGCPDCNSYWQVDHRQRGPQAIKVSEPFKWDSFDDRPYRRKLLERWHGGCSSERCIWAGCKEMALNGIAFCVEHAYPQLSARP